MKTIKLIAKLIALAAILVPAFASTLHAAPRLRAADPAVVIHLREEGESLESIARLLGTTREEVRAAEKAAVARGVAAQGTSIDFARVPCRALVCSRRR
jgi:hypothetical protein